MFEKKININIHTMSFTLFYLFLLITTFFGYAEIYILLCFTILLLYKLTTKTIKIPNIKKNFWLLFVMYYLITTIFGLLYGFVSLKDFLYFFLQYSMLPFIVWNLIPYNLEIRKDSMKHIRNFIIICAIYGLIETLFGFNFLEFIVKIDSKDWIIAMNRTSKAYQSSSFFLHYSYYGIILLLGIHLIYSIPYKNKIINFILGILLFSQLYYTQSRICWIGALIITCIFIFKKKKISHQRLEWILLILVVSAIIIFILFVSENKIFYTIIDTVIGRFGIALKYGMEYGSIGQRIGTLLNWKEFFYNNPIIGIFGAGFRGIDEAFMSYYSYFQGFSTADCQFTIYLVETGLVGTSLIGIAIYQFIKKGNKNFFYLFSRNIIIIFIILSITLDIIGTNFILVLLYWGLMIYYKNNSKESTKSNAINNNL